jgi:hypothetical protein
MHTYDIRELESKSVKQNREGIGCSLSEWRFCWRTILGHKGVVGGVEGEEPVPVRVEPEQHSCGAESASETGGTHRRPRGRGADNGDIPERSHCRGGSDNPSSEALALVVGRVGGEVEDVTIPRVVHREEKPEEPAPVAPSPREEVREAGWRIGPAPDGGSGGRHGGGEAREAEARRGEEERMRERRKETDASTGKTARRHRSPGIQLPAPPLAPPIPVPVVTDRAGEGAGVGGSDGTRSHARQRSGMAPQRGSIRVADGEARCGVATRRGASVLFFWFLRVSGLLGQRKSDKWGRRFGLIQPQAH